MRNRVQWNRRDFLKTASAATLSALAAGFPRAVFGDETTGEKLKATADTVIVLWMGGGMAHTETFDPKGYTPFEKGMSPDAFLSTFPGIDTAVDDIKFSEGLEKTAKVMDRGTLIRSYTAGDLGFILHSRHQCPFNIPFPDQAADTVRPPGGMTPGRFEDRNKFYKKLLAASPVGEHGSDYQKESLLRSLDNAHRLLSSPASKAFDLALEPLESIRKYVPGYQPGQRFEAARDRFGAKYEDQMVGRFGLGCLLARRLAEVGARYIEVTTEYIPFLNWDTHENGHTRAAAMKKQIDSPLSQLVLDLEARGLLNRTLIVLASEFSRDAMIEGKPDKRIKDQVEVPDKVEDPKHYGMHRHFTDAGCVLLFGGGIKKGHWHGLTAEERPCKTIKDRVTIEDLHASIFHALGIPPKLAYEIEKRPFYVTRDGEGKPISALFG